MKDFHFRHVLVVDGETFVGMVTQSELLRLSMSALGGGPAESSLQHAIEHRMFVAQVMERNPPTLSPDDTLAEAARKLVATKAGALAVVESGRLVGILSEIDVLKVAMAYL
jgi:CBS domain-containing protein